MTHIRSCAVPRTRSFPALFRSAVFVFTLVFGVAAEAQVPPGATNMQSTRADQTTALTRRSSTIMNEPDRVFQASESARARFDPRTITPQTKIGGLDRRVSRATNLYRRSVSYPAKGREIPREVIDRAKCVAIFPEITKAALVVGGRHGEGVAACRDGGTWEQTSFIELTGGSLGAQAGVQSSTLLIFFLNDDAPDALREGRFRLGGDIGATAGTYGAELQLEPASGVLAYSLDEGMFAGLAFTGTSLSLDEDAYETLYGDEWKEARERPLDTSRLPAVAELLGALRA